MKYLIHYSVTTEQIDEYRNTPGIACDPCCAASVVEEEALNIASSLE